MIIDANNLPSGTGLEADICIIGAGPAGITLARAFDTKATRVILLEGGNLRRSRAGQALYKGESVGLHYEDLDQARSRHFGGSSNCWGGFCRPLDTHDFEVRDWVPNSGWPISRAELMPYYRRAQTLLELGPFEYDPAVWEQWIGRPDARLLTFEGRRVINMLTQISPPTRFGELYGQEIATSRNVVAYLNANVTEIETPDAGAQVSGVRVRTLGGGSFCVAARHYILATGGIETPRLLLASNRHQAAGVGNQHDLVGRYFMDHPRLRGGSITYTDPAANGTIYDLHSTLAGAIRARGVKIGAYFGLTPDILRAERLGSARCYAVSRFAGGNAASYNAASHLRRALNGTGSLLERSPAELLNILRQSPRVALLAVGHKLKLPSLARGFSLETVVEPTPLHDSRVSLGSELDPLGMPRVTVDWRLGELEKRTIRRTQEIVREEIARVGAGHIVVDGPQAGEPWPAELRGCWHHMGTTRMHADPRQGVVDAQCRVHGIENLFIAGSAVFPTVGSDMPTITIVALTLRLAEHLHALQAEKSGSGMSETQSMATAGATTGVAHPG